MLIVGVANVVDDEIPAEPVQPAGPAMLDFPMPNGPPVPNNR